MQRGFKTHAKRLALEIRAEVDTAPSAPFDPWNLAELYGIPVYDFDNLADSDCPVAALRYFGGRGAERFSAALVPVGTGRLVIENSHHARLGGV